MKVIASRDFNFGGDPVNKGEELLVTDSTGNMLIKTGNAVLPEVEVEEEEDNGDEL